MFIGKRFIFKDQFNNVDEGWIGPFQDTQVPHIDEEVTMIANLGSKKLRTGKVYSISYRYNLKEVYIFLNIIPNP